MKSRFIAASVAAALAGVSVPLSAEPLDRTDITAMAYVSLPFGAIGHREAAPILGFAVERRLPEQASGFGHAPHPSGLNRAWHSLADIRFDMQKQNWDRFRIGGVDALTYTTRMRADGTTEAVGTLAEIPTVAIVAGVVVGAAVIHDATKKDAPPTPAAPTCPPGFVLVGGICF